MKLKKYIFNMVLVLFFSTNSIFAQLDESEEKEKITQGLLGSESDSEFKEEVETKREELLKQALAIKASLAPFSTNPILVGVKDSDKEKLQKELSWLNLSIQVLKDESVKKSLDEIVTKLNTLTNDLINNLDKIAESYAHLISIPAQLSTRSQSYYDWAWSFISQPSEQADKTKLLKDSETLQEKLKNLDEQLLNDKKALSEVLINLEKLNNEIVYVAEKNAAAKIFGFVELLNSLIEKIRTKDIERVNESIQGLQNEYESKTETR